MKLDRGEKFFMINQFLQFENRNRAFGHKIVCRMRLQIENSYVGNDYGESDVPEYFDKFPPELAEAEAHNRPELKSEVLPFPQLHYWLRALHFFDYLLCL